MEDLIKDDETKQEQLDDEATEPEEEDSITTETEEEPEAEEEPEEEKPKKRKKKKSFQERINQLVREKYEALREVEALKQRLAELERGTSPSAPQTTTSLNTGEPKPDDFESYEDYVRALVKWELAQTQYEIQQKTALQKEQEELQKAIKRFESKLPEYRKRYEDFDEVVYDPTVSANDTMRRFILMSDVGGDIAYYLAKNRDVADRLSRLDPIATARELGKIEARIENNLKKTSSSSAPVINPVRTEGGSGLMKSPDKMSFEEYMKWRMKQEMEGG